VPEIKITVAGKIATNTTPGVVIVCGNKDYKVAFDLDDEWAAETARTARFVYYKNGQRLFKDVPFTGDTAAVPALSDIDFVMVGVYAGDLHTTTPAQVLCDRSILCGNAVEQITPEEKAGLVAQMGALDALETTDKSSLVAAVNEVKRTAGTGGSSNNGGTVTDEQIAQAVEDYMAKHPVSGGNVDYVGVEPTHDDIPKVFFSGDNSGMNKDNEKVLQFAYKSRTADFGGYVKMKWQGSSTLAFPKKNFTIKMFEDEACGTKLKKAFKHWGQQKNKYVLKADYIDHTHARNIVTANLWTEMVASRPDFDSLPDGMKNAPGHGAVDGFPIKLYMNGVYQGIYTWTIGKEDWMFGMDESDANQAVLCAEKNNNGNTSTTDANILSCEFRANAKIDGNDWDLEFPDNLHDDIKTSFNNLINCVKDTDDATFKAIIGNYLDLTSAFDYYILAYLSANCDGLGKNLIMMTYDGVKWFCSAYDMDNIWGSRGTNTFVNADYACPEDYYDTNSLLWIRIENCFGAELYARYLYVRKSVLSFENVIDKFERFCDLIGTELYAEDVEIYSGIPYPTQNNLKQIRNFFTPRAEYVDACFAEIGAEHIPCTGISLSANTLTFTAEGAQTLTATVTPDGCTDSIMWESDNTSVATVVGGVVTAIANGSATITAKCGNYSASCTVSVSGIAEPIPCTGITLDKTKISFTEEGSQTIVATVKPDGCTDMVKWASNDTSVALVSNGVVTAVGNGDAVITATCGNYSATCAVSVSGITVTLYAMTEPTTFASTADIVDTGVALWENDRDFSIILDMTTEVQTEEATVFAVNYTNVPYSGIKLFCQKNGTYLLSAYGNVQHAETFDTGIPYNYTGALKMVLTHVAGSGEYVFRFTGSNENAITNNWGIAHGNHLYIGADNGCATPIRPWIGTMNRFEIRGSVMTQSEIEEFIADDAVPLYAMTEPTTFASTADIVDTGVAPIRIDRNWTIAFDMSPEAQTSETCVFVVKDTLKFYCHPTTFGVGNIYGFATNSNKIKTATTIPMSTTERTKMVITHAAGSGSATAYYIVDGENQSVNFTIGTGEGNLYIGADDGWSTPIRPWIGTMNRFEIYMNAFTDEKVNAFLNG
jgi:hypothetical protein